MRKISIVLLLTLISVVSVAIGCQQIGGGGTDTDALKVEVVSNYADGVHALYSTSLASAREMDMRIDAFIADPNPATLEAAKRAWLRARDDYGPTEAFRFYGGPIDNEEDGPEGLINAWPLDEALYRLCGWRSRRRHHQYARRVSGHRRRAYRVAQRRGRRSQCLNRLARHRVPALGDRT